MSIRKNTLWSLLGSVTPMLIGVAALPYIYKFIGIERIGVLTVIWALIGYFSIFDFGLGRAITQRIASLSSRQTDQERETVATTGVILTLLIGTIGGLLGLLAVRLLGVDWINSTPYLEREIEVSFLLACLAIPATTTTAGLRGVLEGEQRFMAISLLRLVLGLSNFLAPIASIALFGPRLDYIVGSLVVARYGILVAQYLCAKREIGHSRSNLSRKEAKQLFKFGGWLTISNVVSPLMTIADRFFIGNILGAALIAYYTIPMDLLFRLLIIPAALTTALFPMFSQKKDDPETIAKYYNGGLKLIFFAMLAIVLAVVFFGRILLEHWLGPDFADKSYTIAVLISIGVLLNSLAQVPFVYIQATGDAKSTTVIHLIEFALYAPSLLYLTSYYGVIGAAVAWSSRAALDFVLLQLRASYIKAHMRNSRGAI